MTVRLSSCLLRAGGLRGYRHVNGRLAELGLGRGWFQAASAAEVTFAHALKAALRASR
jgi:hypothetical protein